MGDSGNSAFSTDKTEVLEKFVFATLCVDECDFEWIISIISPQNTVKSREFSSGEKSLFNWRICLHQCTECTQCHSCAFYLELNWFNPFTLNVLFAEVQYSVSDRHGFHTKGVSRLCFSAKSQTQIRLCVPTGNLKFRSMFSSAEGMCTVNIRAILPQVEEGPDGNKLNMKIISDFASLSEICPDVQLRVNSASFSAHRIILSARSKVFQEMLLSDTEECKSNNIRIINIDGFEEEVIRQLLKFAYTSTLTPTNDISFLLNLWKAAVKFEMVDLKGTCEALLVKDVYNFILHSCKIADGDIFSQTELKNAVLAMIGSNSEKFECK